MGEGISNRATTTNKHTFSFCSSSTSTTDWQKECVLNHFVSAIYGHPLLLLITGVIQRWHSDLDWSLQNLLLTDRRWSRFPPGTIRWAPTDQAAPQQQRPWSRIGKSDCHRWTPRFWSRWRRASGGLLLLNCLRTAVCCCSFPTGLVSEWRSKRYD